MSLISLSLNPITCPSHVSSFILSHREISSNVVFQSEITGSSARLNIPGADIDRNIVCVVGGGGGGGLEEGKFRYIRLALLMSPWETQLWNIAICKVQNQDQIRTKSDKECRKYLNRQQVIESTLIQLQSPVYKGKLTGRRAGCQQVGRCYTRSESHGKVQIQKVQILLSKW